MITFKKTSLLLPVCVTLLCIVDLTHAASRQACHSRYQQCCGQKIPNTDKIGPGRWWNSCGGIYKPTSSCSCTQGCANCY